MGEVEREDDYSPVGKFCVCYRLRDDTCCLCV